MRKKSRITLNRMSKWQYALLLLMLVTFIPALSLWLPSLMK